MRATTCALGALLLVLALTTSAHAWTYTYAPQPANAFSPPCCYPYWNTGCYGGFNSWPPCSPPFQGIQANLPFGGGNCMGPYARSPRDYFMIDP